MNIIICGAGKVGFSISKQLSSQGHSVTVIDQSSEDIKKINETQDVKGIVGRATLPSVLENAGAQDADMIIAVTKNDETNMIVCQIASSLFNISKKIARIRSQEYLDPKFSKVYSIDNRGIQCYGKHGYTYIYMGKRCRSKLVESCYKAPHEIMLLSQPNHVAPKRRRSRA